MLSKKAKYGLRALVHLAHKYGQGTTLISQLAQDEKIPKKFLEIILLDLRKHGILQSQKGKGGGYQLNKAPEEINLGDVIRILDGPLAPIPCVSKTAYARCADCRDEKTCEIRRVFQQVRDAISVVLDGKTLADMANT
jgi:Rrf2 family protein